MARSMFFEENDDGTITLTVNFGEILVDQKFVIPFDFDSMFASMPIDVMENAQAFARSNVVHIPDQPEEL